MADLSSPMSAFEASRQARIEENRRRMEEMGVLDTARALEKSFKPPPGATKAIAKRTRASQRPRKGRRQPTRRSPRLSGEAVQHRALQDKAVAYEERVTYSDAEDGAYGLDDILADASDAGEEGEQGGSGRGEQGEEEEEDAGDIQALTPERQQQFQELRCTSAGRGSMYDSVVGITCHFCRQKKLCGEEGCPRCSRRSTTAQCIGKTECTRCGAATGRFCRACLQLRYGQTLERVRAEMAAGTWLCPHCYEDDHPDDGWMCNSSICMTRRGFKPTGIAIYDAQQRGYASVAHWLQAQLRKRHGGGGGGGAGSSGAVAPSTPPPTAPRGAGAAAAGPSSSSDSNSSGSGSNSSGGAEAPAAGGRPVRAAAAARRAAAKAQAAAPAQTPASLRTPARRARTEEQTPPAAASASRPQRATRRSARN